MRQTRSYINLEVREHNKTAVNNFKKRQVFQNNFNHFISCKTSLKPLSRFIVGKVVGYLPSTQQIAKRWDCFDHVQNNRAHSTSPG